MTATWDRATTRNIVNKPGERLLTGLWTLRSLQKSGIAPTPGLFPGRKFSGRRSNVCETDPPLPIITLSLYSDPNHSVRDSESFVNDRVYAFQLFTPRGETIADIEVVAIDIARKGV